MVKILILLALLGLVTGCKDNKEALHARDLQICAKGSDITLQVAQANGIAMLPTQPINAQDLDAQVLDGCEKAIAGLNK